MRLCSWADGAIPCSGEFECGIGCVGRGFCGADFFKGGRAGLEGFLETLTQIVAAVGDCGGRCGFGWWAWRTLDKIWRGERTHPQIEFRSPIGLLGGWQKERAQAKVWSPSGRDLAVRRTCVHILIGGWRGDLKVPGGLEKTERVEHGCAPRISVCGGDLCVANVHWHVAGPSGHLAGYFCCLDGDVEAGRFA